MKGIVCLSDKGRESINESEDYNQKRLLGPKTCLAMVLAFSDVLYSFAKCQSLLFESLQELYTVT